MKKKLSKNIKSYPQTKRGLKYKLEITHLQIAKNPLSGIFCFKLGNSSTPSKLN